MIALAVADLCDPDLSYEKRCAGVWIYSPLQAKDFRKVCEMAGVDPEWVRRVARMRTTEMRRARMGQIEAEGEAEDVEVESEEVKNGDDTSDIF